MSFTNDYCRKLKREGEKKIGHHISNVYFALIWFYHVSTKLEKLERPELNYAMIHILFFLCILKVPMRQKKNMQFSSKRIFSQNWWWHGVWYCTVYFLCSQQYEIKNQKWLRIFLLYIFIYGLLIEEHETHFHF